MRKITPPPQKKMQKKNVSRSKIDLCVFPYQSILRLNDLVNGKILRNYTANRYNYRSRQSLKAIVQVEVEAIAEVIVNAWPFQWRQVDTPGGLMIFSDGGVPL